MFRSAQVAQRGVLTQAKRSIHVTSSNISANNPVAWSTANRQNISWKNFVDPKNPEKFFFFNHGLSNFLRTALPASIGILAVRHIQWSKQPENRIFAKSDYALYKEKLAAQKQ